MSTHTRLCMIAIKEILQNILNEDVEEYLPYFGVKQMLETSGLHVRARAITVLTLDKDLMEKFPHDPDVKFVRDELITSIFGMYGHRNKLQEVVGLNHFIY